jgi:hypothetical protein
MEIDIAAERRQVFEEAWRVMKNRFYDAKMHGVNWEAAKDKYQSILPHIADNEELHNLIMEMIGELNASHTGITGGSRLPGAPAQERIATLGKGQDLPSHSYVTPSRSSRSSASRRSASRRCVRSIAPHISVGVWSAATASQ